MDVFCFMMNFVILFSCYISGLGTQSIV